MKSAKRVTVKEFEEVLRTVNRRTSIVLGTLTPVEVNKTVQGAPNPFYQCLMKRAMIRGVIGFWYAEEVNRKRDAEGKPTDFAALPHGYADHVPNTPLMAHRVDGRLFLPVNVTKSLGYAYEANGDPVASELVEPWLKVKKESSRQGLDSPVLYRTYSLGNIISCELDEVLYVIGPDHSNEPMKGTITGAWIGSKPMPITVTSFDFKLKPRRRSVEEVLGQLVEVRERRRIRAEADAEDNSLERSILSQLGQLVGDRSTRRIAVGSGKDTRVWSISSFTDGGLPHVADLSLERIEDVAWPDAPATSRGGFDVLKSAEFHAEEA